MSFLVRDWVKAQGRLRLCPPAPQTTGASGPSPSLVDVLERHPDWRDALIAELARKPTRKTYTYKGD